MDRFRTFAIALIFVLPLAGCERQAGEEGAATEAPVAETVLVMPVTTGSDEARDRFVQGLTALDMGRPDDAIPHFDAALEADADFALAHLYRAFAANSLDDFRAHLDAASEKAVGASEAEALMIEAAVRNFEGDAEGELDAARRLTEAQPSSPRAWMTLATAQSGMGDEEAARASIQRAAELAPNFVAPHMALGNSYLFVEPRDLAAAETHMRAAVELAPDEPVPHDLLGDTYRAQGELEEAADEYTRTAELDTDSGSGYQQRAHVHSFLANYEQARADYDAAVELERGTNLAPSFRVYRALVHVHEGNPEAAVEELRTIEGEIDGMGVPEPRGQKIFVLDNIALIAMHSGMLDVAEQALESRNALLEEQAERSGTDAARRDARAAAAIDAGFLAAHRGDFETATTKAEEYMSIMESSNDPEKDEPAHALLGFVALQRGNHDDAVAHFEQADADDIYVVHHHALALEGAGRADEARELFEKVANWNFNSAELALVRKDAASRIGAPDSAEATEGAEAN